MIHAQRADATACATFDFSNKPMNHYIKGGPKGIALLDNSGGKSKLKYVLDVSDTEDGRQNVRRPLLWEMTQEHQAPVIGALRNSYDIEAADSGEADRLGEYIFTVAQSLAAR